MTIQQLQYVMEISRTGSVSKAAKNAFPFSAKLKQCHQEPGK